MVYVQEFLNFMNFDHGTAKNAIGLGQKILVNERMFPGFSGSTALYAFCQDTFRRVLYDGLKNLNQLLQVPDYHSICSLAVEKALYVENAQRIYCDTSRWRLPPGPPTREYFVECWAEGGSDNRLPSM
ncbi:hypothetical protein ACJ73_04290 [Blastomyces percursus]|uniref:Uncharacterized protein n=1 Tax=Blastomyces percursus TaxID=1658174 RepID=A0A1J9QVU6_9EURO|nr:hypothetical protein ACJ73_04290 [Blastomyces percursus]